MNSDDSNDVLSRFVAEVRHEIARWGYVELDALPAILGVSSAQCHELIRRDDFPAPAMAGGRDVLPLWERHEIDRWRDASPGTHVLRSEEAIVLDPRP